MLGVEKNLKLSMDEARDTRKSLAKQKLLWCADWLGQQSSEYKPSPPDKLDECLDTKDEKKHLVVEESVPCGVNEQEAKPVFVDRRELSTKCLRLECEWQGCGHVMSDYEKFQQHVSSHTSHVHVMKDNDSSTIYVCLWDICGHKTTNWGEMVRHINYHSYHAKLLAIGLNGRATLDLLSCKKDSSQRNQLPLLKYKHKCLWVDCEMSYNSIQMFFDHVKSHVIRFGKSQYVCSWGGCGLQYVERVHLLNHLRTHTGFKQIACYHCGLHFANYRKLVEHIDRQNASESGYTCGMCGAASGSAYLLQEHERQHVSQHVCTYCDMSVATITALAAHVRYRHMSNIRHHACHLCSYRSKTKTDLRSHLAVHAKNAKKLAKKEEDSMSDDDLLPEIENDKKKTVPKKYCCHMCPENEAKIFSRGNRLTTHLVRIHGVQWPFGHSRFRYQISSDGMYRLTTTRYESLEVSKKIMERKSNLEPPKENLHFKIEKVIEPTETKPKQLILNFETELTAATEPKAKSKMCDMNKKLKLEIGDVKPEIYDVKTETGVYKNELEITMCEVDEQGNIISTKVINDLRSINHPTLT